MKNLKHIFYCGLVIMIVQSCSSLDQLSQPHLKQGMAWALAYSRSIVTLPGATPEEKKKVTEAQKDSTQIAWTTYMAKDQFRRSLHGDYASDFIIDIKNDKVLMRYNDGDQVSFDYTDFAVRSQKDTVETMTEVKLYPDSLKTIKGFESYKATYRIKNDSIRVSSWNAKAFPSWASIIGKEVKIPGLALKTQLVKGHILQKIKLVSVRQIPITDTLFHLSSDIPFQSIESSDGEEMGYWDAPDSEFEKQHQQLYEKVLKMKKKQHWKESALEKYGYIQIETKDTTFYVDKNGKYVFDKILSTHHPIGKVESLGPGWVNLKRVDSITILMVAKKGKIGLIQSNSGWVLPAEYDRMYTDFKRYLAIYKDGKMGYADTWGNLLVPAKFDEVKIMNTNYFDVRLGKKWSVYSRKQEKLILPVEFDKFDFCGGCGGTVDYAYASKNGKWGVISFEGEVLLPFKFEHPYHGGMRSDEWVISFEQNGKDVIINLNTQNVYSPDDYEDMEIINGVLALKKNGKYGLIGSHGEQLLPFDYDDMGDPYTNLEWGPFIQIYKNGTSGITTNKGKIIIPPNKYKAIYVEGEVFGAKTHDGHWVVLNQQGNVIIPLDYSVPYWRYPEKAIDSTGKTNLIFTLEKGGKSGFYNLKTGDFVPPKFSSFRLRHPHKNTQHYIEVALTKEGNRGLYSIYGEELIPPKYATLNFLNQRFVTTKTRRHYGLYDIENAKEIAPVEYATITAIDKRFYMLKKPDSCQAKVKFYDAQKEEFFSLPFKEIELAGSGMLTVNDSLNTYLYDLRKRKTVSKGYAIQRYNGYAMDGIDHEEHGLFEVTDSTKTGYINQLGQEVIPAIYDRGTLYENGIVQLINEDKNKVVTFRYADSTGRFLSDVIFSYKNDYYHDHPYKFKKGKYMVIARYDAESDYNFFGLMTQEGEVILPPNYTNIYRSKNNNGFMVERFEAWGVFDENGNEIVPVVLDNIYTSVSYPATVKDLSFPVLCELEGLYFYVKKNGELLPFVTDEVKQRRGW